MGCAAALLVAASLVGARALSSPGQVPVGVAADDDAQVPPDYLRMRALGGAATVSRAALHRAAAQAAAIGSAGGSWEYVGANNIGGRVTDVVVDPTPAPTRLRRLGRRRRLEEHGRRPDLHGGLAERLPAGDRLARPRLGRHALGRHR